MEFSGNIVNKIIYFEIFIAGEGRLLRSVGLGGELLGFRSRLKVLGVDLVFCGRSWYR